LSSKHLIYKYAQASKPSNSLDAVAAGICFSSLSYFPFDLINDADNMPNQPTTPPLPNSADVSDSFLADLVQVDDPGIPYIQMPSARSADLSAPFSKLASSKSLLPSMTTVCSELKHREEDYKYSESHDFLYQDSESEDLIKAILAEPRGIGSASEGVISGYDRPAVPHQHSPSLTVNPSPPSSTQALGKRKTISGDEEDNNSVSQERIRRQAVEPLNTRLFPDLRYMEKSSCSVQKDMFADLVDPQILELTSAGSLPNALPHLTPISLPGFASAPKSIVASAPSYDFYATSESESEFEFESSSGQASISTSPAATITQSTQQGAAQAPAVIPVAFSASQQPPFIPIITPQQPLPPAVPTTTAHVAAQHQGTAGVSNQPIFPAIKSAGIQRYPWTQVRRLMWMAKQNKTAADLPDEAFLEKYNLAHTGTPENGNLRLLGRIHVTICEVLTYFPLSPTIREIAYRLAEANWKASDIIKYVFWTRNITDNNAIKRSTVHKMLDEGKKWAAGTTVQATAELGSLDLASGLTGWGADLIDFPLFSLADNVVNHPSGQDAGVLTRCIKLCRATANQQITMEGAETYAISHGICDDYALVRNSNVRTEDKAALGRVRQTSSTWFRSAGLQLK
jgi:hypothetical protein